MNEKNTNLQSNGLTPKKSNASIIIILLLLIIVIGLGVACYLFATDKIVLNKENETTTTNVVTTDDNKTITWYELDDNENYGNGLYASLKFFTYGNKLYVNVDDVKVDDKSVISNKENINGKDAIVLLDNVDKFYIVEEGNSGYEFAFAIVKDELYYIENIKSNNNKILSSIKVSGVTNVKEVISESSVCEDECESSSIEAYAVLADGTKFNLFNFLDSLN